MLKSGLLVLALIWLSLMAACSNSSVTPGYESSTMENSPTLEKVALVVPSIY